jgi:hypothetical protein
MDATPATRDALLSAVNALAGSVPPNVIIPSLRQLLHAMTAEPAATAVATPRNVPKNGDVSNRSKRRKAGNGAAKPAAADDTWRALREAVRKALHDRGVSRAQLADVLGFTHHSLVVQLAPSGHTPGPETIAKYRTWLANGAEVAGPGAATFPGRGAGAVASA